MITGSELTSMAKINLMNFHDPRIEESGELSIMSRFKNNIYLRLGTDLLTVERVPDPTRKDDRELRDQARNLFIVKNTLEDSSTPLVISDETVPVGAQTLRGLGQVFLRAGRTVTIGRRATPGLKLSKTVSREHLMMRIGSMFGSLHFKDLASKNGTLVYVSQQDERLLSTPRRYYEIREGEMIAQRAIEGRWL